ncbi:hypothetical protein ASF99_01225 [Exiguobacterium sp. Leaf187]|uniref:LysR family transcriptional regulator n=1 Tax=Exiguobacterium sp. Leaf187 TaxID=1736294 RepID=UPI0006F9424F|nr:LysR family transcriptional regulator [Exiguobacterium sp. Leaf187]KQS18546.1 hypothetical protein ASF99_01225 [Exiguobacterium sp. Leaf187]
MELLHLKYFRHVAEELNVTRAAERLFISQPALSATIKKLERELNTTLFHRKGRTISLTDNGRLLLQSVEKIEHELTRVQERMARNDASTETPLSLASSHGRFIQLILREFLLPQTAPLFNSDILSNRDILSGLLHQEFHFSISFMELKHPLITSEPIVEEEIVITYPASYSEKEAITALYADATETAFLFPSHNKDYNRFIQLKMAELNIYADTTHYIDDVSLQLALRQQRYFSFVPVSVCREMGLPFITDDVFTVTSQLYMSHATDQLTVEQAIIYERIKRFLLSQRTYLIK